jgi:BASS family bile acid:Na+ symporter
MKALTDSGIIFFTVIMTLAIGMDLESRSFGILNRRKSILGVALAGQMLMLPLIGWWLSEDLEAHLAGGFLLLAACPVGDIANLYTMLARANVALSVSVNTISCLLSVITMSVVFTLYDWLPGKHFVFAAPPPKIILELILLVALPVLAGMALRRYLPNFVNRQAPRLRSFFVVCLVLLLSFVLATQRDRLAIDWKTTAWISSLLIILASAAGWAVSFALRLDAREIVTFMIIFPVRNVGLASAVAITILDKIEYAVVATIYLLVQIPILLGIVTLYMLFSSTSFKDRRGLPLTTVEKQ